MKLLALLALAAAALAQDDSSAAPSVQPTTSAAPSNTPSSSPGSAAATATPSPSTTTSATPATFTSCPTQYSIISNKFCCVGDYSSSSCSGSCGGSSNYQQCVGNLVPLNAPNFASSVLAAEAGNGGATSTYSTNAAPTAISGSYVWAGVAGAGAAAAFGLI